MLAFLLVAVPWASVAQDAPPAPPKAVPQPAARQTWVVFGDSLVAGGKPGTRWSDVVQYVTGHRVINSGRNRSTTRQALEFIDGDVLAHQPDLVFISFGINDQRIDNDRGPDGYKVPPDEFARNLETMIGKVRGAGAEVVLMTKRPLLQGPGAPDRILYLDRYGQGGRLYTLPGKVKDSIQLYNDIVRRLAAEHGTHLIDIWQAVVDAAGGSDSDEAVLKVGLEREGASLDGVHLGMGGIKFYALTVLNALPRLMPEATGAGVRDPVSSP